MEDFDVRLENLRNKVLEKTANNADWNIALSTSIVELFPEIFPKFENVKKTTEENPYDLESFTEKLDEFINKAKEDYFKSKHNYHYHFSTALETVFPDVFKGSNY